MMGSFSGDATTPLVVKSGTKLTWLKIELNQQKHLYGVLKSKSCRKQTPPKEDILIIITISKFSNTKKLTQKRPPKV